MFNMLNIEYYSRSVSLDGGSIGVRRVCLGISTAAEMSNGPGQITPPNHNSSGIVYFFGCCRTFEQKLNKTNRRRTTTWFLVRERLPDKCEHTSCTYNKSRIKLLTKRDDLIRHFLKRNDVQIRNSTQTTLLSSTAC